MVKDDIGDLGEARFVEAFEAGKRRRVSRVRGHTKNLLGGPVDRLQGGPLRSRLSSSWGGLRCSSRNLWAVFHFLVDDHSTAASVSVNVTEQLCHVGLSPTLL